MAKILITSGPTRQYIDPVRYLTNASSGRMGSALAAAALELGHEVVVVSGPVEVEYPDAATIVWVTSTEEMLEAAEFEFDSCDGMIGAAAPCDYRPEIVARSKIAKTGEPLRLELVETEDVVATLGAKKDFDPEGARRWVVGFALETEDHRLRALAKLERKHCDLMVSNGVEAMNALDNTVEVISPSGEVLAALSGSKAEVARGVLRLVDDRLVRRRR
jgi:phosphopantothenoylcysteine decarboxylase/phosphopantothenate--cysteine ligase